MYWLLNEDKQKAIRESIDSLVLSLSEINYKAPHKDQVFPFQGRKAIDHAKMVIQSLSSDQDSISDPFSGSGSFAYAGAQLKRTVFSNEYEPYTARMAYTPFNLPDKKLLTDTFQDLVTTLKPSTDHYYRTQCECGEILPLDSLFYDRVPLRHTGISLHERLGKTGENITFRRQFKCPKCGATEKFFDEYDQGVLDEIEKLPDHKIFDFKLIENSRINLNLNRAEGSH